MTDDLITIHGRWEFEYEYFAGEAASRFFRELRDNGRIMGTVCPSCGRVLVPARSFCDACFEPTDEWREIGTHGRVDAFSILTATFPGLPEPPLAIGYVTLDGADTALLNFITGIDLATSTPRQSTCSSARGRGRVRLSSARDGSPTSRSALI